MAGDDKVTVFAAGNGDAIFLEARGKRILTDVNYCKAAQEGEDGYPDIGETIRQACVDDHLHLFVLTHPDEDHLRGFTELFHTGTPETHDPDPDEGSVKIIIDEMWCSPYGAEPNYTTDVSKPVIEEIQRRKKLLGTERGKQIGNRLRTLDAVNTPSGEFAARICWELLAPTPAEATIPEGEDDNRPSSNPSSLVIRWAIGIDDRDNLVLLGGDSTVDVWERIRKDNHESSPGRLSWNILVPPHHTSRYTLGRKDENDQFHYSDEAIDALSGQQGTGWMVSSSKEILNNNDDPPSWSAKQRYLKILANGGEVSDDVRSRFLCTGEHDNGKPGNVVFYLTKRGPSQSRGGPKTSSTLSSVGGGGSYG